LGTLDHSKIPNLKNLEARFTGPAFDDGNKYSVPYQWGTVGLLYDKKKLARLDPTWGALLDPKKIQGTFVLMDEMRDMLGVALKFKGYSSNTTSAEEIRQAGRALQDAKAHAKCLGFKGGIGAVQDVKDGSAEMAIVWNGDAQKAMLEDKDGRLAYIIPKEGSIIWIDVLLLMRRAPQPELAYKFINFVLAPEVGARISAFTKQATPNAVARAQLPEEDRKNPAIYPPDEIAKSLEHHKDVGDTLKVFDEVWTSVKAR
jgi:spermidine/putrescine transport system substrate-binding protein